MHYVFIATVGIHTTGRKDDELHRLRRDAEAGVCSSLRVWDGRGNTPIAPYAEPCWRGELVVPNGQQAGLVLDVSAEQLDALIAEMTRAVGDLVP